MVLENDSYFLVNGRVGYHFNKESMEVALAVYNLLDDKHYEYPEPFLTGLPGDVPVGGDRLRRQITASFNYKF
jgi:outer membrane receptor protein involved in Fe transport